MQIRESGELLVVGSGPAGISAASALVEKGHRVTLLDGGVDLELS